MSGAQTNEAAFNIGIAMAGAVSGGAYMAGVFDFLMEALNEWQKLKDDPRADVPRHDVFISAISGTSAGGITAALGLVALAGGIRSVEAPSVDPKSPPIRRVLPPLYDLWVKKLKLCGSREEPVDSRVQDAGVTPEQRGRDADRTRQHELYSSNGQKARVFHCTHEPVSHPHQSRWHPLSDRVCGGRQILDADA
jgi:predicted acylesterase/phospholipase RssA